MTTSLPVISLEVARRLTIARQRLAGARRFSSRAKEIESVVADLGYVQWDPVTIVGPSHLLSLWARVDGLRPSDLERLLWRERRLFLHWLPMASIVRTEDYPIFSSLMRRYPGSLTHSWRPHQEHAARFLKARADLRTRVLRLLEKGPLRLSDFEEHRSGRGGASDWAPASAVSEMLSHLEMKGEVMVVGHRGAQNLWGLAKEFLPPWTPRADLSEDEFEEAAAERAIRALGTASAPEITYYFVRGRYHDLPGALRRLQKAKRIYPIRVEGLPDRESRYIHGRDLSDLESLRTAEEGPRTTLLPPFDNLLAGKQRNHRLFSFDYVREQFLPPAKRRYGTYVLPILHGERLIGRIDPRMDRNQNALVVQAIHAEPGAPAGREVARSIAGAIDRLGEFLGADSVEYTGSIPSIWMGPLG